MDFLELAKNRFSLRKFSDKKVEKEKIDYILAAMQAARSLKQGLLLIVSIADLIKIGRPDFRVLLAYRHSWYSLCHYFPLPILHL